MTHKQQLNDIYDGLKARGVSDANVKAIAQTFKKNKMDRRAIIKDISDREQSLLLKFFRNDLHNVHLFYILFATINNWPIKQGITIYVFSVRGYNAI